jgi:hypothetical protein
MKLPFIDPSPALREEYERRLGKLRKELGEPMTPWKRGRFKAQALRVWFQVHAARWSANW